MNPNKPNEPNERNKPNKPNKPNEPNEPNDSLNLAEQGGPGALKFIGPEKKACTVVLTFEFDAESVEWGYKKSISGADDIGAFSPRQGIRPILALLDEYNIKSTFFVPGWDAQRHPGSVAAIAEAGHEIAAHGYQHEDFSALSLRKERAVFEKAHQILTDAAGKAPVGFRSAAYGAPLSEHTLSIAASMGYQYDSSYLDDDVPYRIFPAGRRRSMVEIPWAWPLNDLVFMSPPVSCGLGFVLPPRPPAWVLQFWQTEFDALLDMVGFFHLVLHPRDIGRGSRLVVLRELITYIARHDVEFMTCARVAAWVARKDRAGQTS